MQKTYDLSPEGVFLARRFVAVVVIALCASMLPPSLAALDTTSPAAAIPAHAGGSADEPCSWATGFHFVGPEQAIETSVVFDDGNGPALYIGGRFETASDKVVGFVARWDGADWQPLTTGIDGFSVETLAVFDD